MTPIDKTQFVQLVQPLLEAQDLQGLFTLLKTRWQPHQILDLLHSSHSDPDHADAKKVALLALGLVGPSCCIAEVARELKDPDPVVNGLAEHALWSLWFRGSKSCEANRQLARGADAMNKRDFEKAIAYFNDALHVDPDFAEAYNQRAIAHYLQEHFEQSVCDCRRAVRRMPCHFGAWSGLGHGYAHLGKTQEAIESYEKALEVNPHLECIKQTVAALKQGRAY